MIFTSFFITYKASEYLYNNTETIPKNKVGLVLGASKYTSNGNINLYYKYRVDAALDLYKAKKIDFLLISGDNSREGYDEPTDFKNDLIAEGIPEDKIYLDYAGFRTLDSVVRCKEVFGQNNFIIISQEFHVARALFIAKKFNIDAIGYAAKSPPQSYSFKTNFREFFARTRAVIDLYVLNTQPKFLGSKETILID